MTTVETMSKKHQENHHIHGINEVLAHLKEVKDVEGVILVEEDKYIMASALPDHGKYENELSDILNNLWEWGKNVPANSEYGMFTQNIFEHNGYTILTKRMRNLTLLVMMQKSGYIGLTMIEIENSIREIDKILRQIKLKNFFPSLLNLTAIFNKAYKGPSGTIPTQYGERNER